MGDIRKRLWVVLCLVACVGGTGLAQQKGDPFAIEHARTMLSQVHDEVKKNYYDTKYHGVDIDARYHQYDDRIKKATSLGQGITLVAAYLDGLQDSHTFFEPPPRPYRVESCYEYQIIGETPFITAVRPGTDAAEKLAPGDQVISLNTYSVNRDDIFQLNYFLRSLVPQTSTILVLKKPDGKQSQVTVNAKTRQLKKVLDLTGASGGDDFWQLVRDSENADHLLDERYYKEPDVTIWKMPVFSESPDQVDHMFSIARERKALILDLRGNPGGFVVTLERVLGNLFDHDVKVGDRVGRKEMKPEIGKTRGKDAYSGKLVVLVDSQSASSAELLARVVQLEKRGTVVGDRTWGKVMEAEARPLRQGTDTKIFYGLSVTIADLIMKDGKSLEGTGVTPDEIVLPTAQDLAQARDPALAQAAEIVGLKLSAEQAGKMFPVVWAPE